MEGFDSRPNGARVIPKKCRKEIMKFDVAYRRTIHAELDALLDVSETVRVGKYEHQDFDALAERTARKWALDSLLMAAMVAQYGRDRVVDSLSLDIERYRRMVDSHKPTEPVPESFAQNEARLVKNYERAIALLTEIIAKL